MRNKHLFNESATLYVPYRQPGTANYTHVRVVVPNVHWEENSLQILTRTGIVPATQSEVYFMRYDNDPAAPKQILPTEWGELPFDDMDFLEKHYCLSLTGSEVIFASCALLRGIISQRYDWTTLSNITMQMNTLLQNTPGSRRLSQVNYNWYGNRNLHHVVVR